MNFTIYWYYWYKNFWDELLLLGLINFLDKNFTVDSIQVVAKDPSRVNSRVSKNKNHLENDKLDLEFVEKLSSTRPQNTLILWWWEVLTPERPLIHRWWSYFWRIPSLLFRKNHRVVWWLWKPKSILDRVLYHLVLWRSQKIITRNPESYEIARNFSDQVLAHRDFARDVLDDLVQKPQKKAEKPYIVINVNKHILNKKTTDLLAKDLFEYPEHKKYFFPWSVGSDDSDAHLFEQLLSIIPDLEIYDRSENTLLEILDFMSWASYVVAARLHVLILCKHLWLPFRPLVYQEKIQRILEEV